MTAIYGIDSTITSRLNILARSCGTCGKITGFAWRNIFRRFFSMCFGHDWPKPCTEVQKTIIDVYAQTAPGAMERIIVLGGGFRCGRCDYGIDIKPDGDTCPKCGYEGARTSVEGEKRQWSKDLEVMLLEAILEQEFLDVIVAYDPADGSIAVDGELNLRELARKLGGESK